MSEAQEKKNRKIAMITSIGVHVVILVLLLFMVAWRTPNPPLPEFGIELNFGMDTQGSGDIQPQTPVGVTESEPEESEEALEELPQPEAEEIEEEVVEEATPEETQPAQQEVTSKVESPVVVEEKKEVKPVEKPTEKPVEKVVESKPEVKPTPEIPKAVYKPKTESTDGKATDRTGAQGNQGDDVDKTGDKGDPEGTLDSKALYGKQGGGGGGVSMIGFGGFGHPDIDTPPLPEESYGIYEFKVKVDEQGLVISVTPVQRGLSFEAERRLKAAIQQLQFIPRGNPKPAEGTITFRVIGK